MQQMIGRIRVDMRVAGDHADVLAAENFNQVEELLRHQSLDRSRVIGTAARAQRGEMHAEPPPATLPEPVGVFKMTWSPASRSMMASS